MIGFIMIRHINSERTNLLWQESYECIRKFYDNKIVIIDDNSDTTFVTIRDDLVNVEIIQSDFPGRAELLPYYYFLKYAWFDFAVIFHDSVFIQEPIRFRSHNIFLWHFETHIWDNTEYETQLIRQLSNSEGLLNFYNNKTEWNGCFGVMSVMQHNFLDYLNNKYNIFELLKYIKTREQRMCLERVFAALLSYEAKLPKGACSYFGNIEAYCDWRFDEKYTIEKYKEDKKNGKLNLRIVKLWTGR